MKKLLIFLLLALVLTGCTEAPLPTTVPTTVPTTQPVTEAPTEDTTQPATEPPTVETTLPETVPTEPAHSALYIEGLSVEDVILYFNEVCLDSEFVNGGDPSLIQKWVQPIFYRLHGSYTQEDLAVLEGMVAWLNTVEGFPEIREAAETEPASLEIHFCTGSELVSLLGDNFYGCDGGVTYWYTANEINDAIICYRNDISQYIRNSVILEEIYNGLGPVQDTFLRADSIIFGGYSEPQALTAVDELLLRLLYHPDILCGMNASQCEEVIRRLYY